MLVNNMSKIIWFLSMWKINQIHSLSSSSPSVQACAQSLHVNRFAYIGFVKAYPTGFVLSSPMTNRRPPQFEQVRDMLLCFKYGYITF